LVHESCRETGGILSIDWGFSGESFDGTPIFHVKSMTYCQKSCDQVSIVSLRSKSRGSLRPFASRSGKTATLDPHDSLKTMAIDRVREIG
jgi:hypothetical protein